MNEKSRSRLRRASVIFFWILFLLLSFLFFTNDFGLVDIHKTSIIVAVGIDTTEEQVQVTAQLAVPKPSQSGENIEYTEVQGCGETVSDALNEINAKTGFYPQLHFCKLILLGESCKNNDIFRVLGCLYRKNYSELTALVAMCNGKACQTLAMPTLTSDMTTTVIQRALSSELEQSANVSSVTLKDIAVAHFSRSEACYMPLIEANVQGTSEEGDDVGGDEPKTNSSGEGSSSSSSQGGGCGGDGSGSSSGGKEGGGSSSGDSSSSSGSGNKKPVEFTAKRTVIFKNGMYAGILNEQQAFALNIIKNSIRLAVLPCDTGEYHYTIGLGMADGGMDVAIVDNVPQVTFNFRAYAQITGIKRTLQPHETNFDDKLSPELIQVANKALEERLASLMEVSRQTDCDFIGIKEQIFKKHYKRFDDLQFDALQKMQIKYNIDVKSRNS